MDNLPPHQQLHVAVNLVLHPDCGQSGVEVLVRDQGVRQPVAKLPREPVPQHQVQEGAIQGHVLRERNKTNLFSVWRVLAAV